MPRFLKYLLLVLTVVAVGAAQVVGAQASYFCECTGQKTVLESCEPSCHDGVHDHSDCHGSHAENKQSGGDTLPAEPEHEHDQVLEKLVGIHIPPLLHSPAVVWIAVLTDPFPGMAPCVLNTPWTATFDNEPPERKTLSEGVRIARTTVMLV